MFFNGGGIRRTRVKGSKEVQLRGTLLFGSLGIRKATDQFKPLEIYVKIGETVYRIPKIAKENSLNRSKADVSIALKVLN